MTHDDLQSIHQRLDILAERLSEIHAAVTAQQAVCQGARAKIERHEQLLLGNGREGIQTRLERLETVSALRGRGFWAAVAFLSALVSGLFVVLGQAALTLWLE